MERDLDNLETIKRHDTKDMLSIIGRFPKDAQEAIRDSEKLDVTSVDTEDTQALLIAGMGGSAVGGLLLKDWLSESCNIPIIVSRRYHLPAWFDDNVLLYVVSYSGNTEETLSQFREASELNCPMICFTSGGELSLWASKKKIPAFHFPKGYQPRAAIAFQFFGLAGVSRRLGLIDDETWSEVEEALKVLKTLSESMDPKRPVEKNLGKSLALSLKGYIPFTYGSPLYENVSYRYSTQFNENSKSPSAASFLPEAFHNSVMAREADPKLVEKCCVVVIRDKNDASIDPKTVRFMRLMSERFGRIVEVEPIGKGRLSRMLSALYIGDFASAYLSILYGNDPSTTYSIDLLKKAES
jgi:glucose/mannose-6-phosphate isomerase